MMFVTVQGQTFQLSHLVKYVTHIGQREIGVTESVRNPEPIFGDFRYVELFFVDGSVVQLDGVQTEAFLSFLEGRALVLDLDRVDESALGHIVVHDTAEGGDIILPDQPPGE